MKEEYWGFVMFLHKYLQKRGRRGCKEKQRKICGERERERERKREREKGRKRERDKREREERESVCLQLGYSSIHFDLNYLVINEMK
jgi:hypothetical protein